MMRKFIQTMVVMSGLLISTVVLALDPVYTPLFSNKAIKGYDTVAYFTENKPVKGSSDFKTEYQGAQWYFSSQENLDLFLADPEKYAPQYGGYCAFAVAKNTTASIKPELFTIENGKLYLNYNNDINETWQNNRQLFIELADQNWPQLLAK